jgi:ABC-type glycerol-3-phosphate transport system substrate-binding protein
VEKLPYAAVVAFALLAVYYVVTAGETDASRDRPITLDFVWPTYTPQKVRYGEYLKEKYEADHPDIYINLMKTPDPYLKMQVMIAGRTTPDVVWMGVGWEQFQDALMPLDERVAQDPALGPDTYFPRIWEACKWNGTLRALPSSGQVGIVYYNKDLFDEAGLEYPTEA